MLRLIAKSNILRLEKELALCGDEEIRMGMKARLERERRRLLDIEASVGPKRAGPRPIQPGGRT